MTDACSECASRKRLGGAYDLKCTVCCASYINLGIGNSDVLKRHFCLIDTTPNIPSIESIFDALKKRIPKKRFDFVLEIWDEYKAINQ